MHVMKNPARRAARTRRLFTSCALGLCTIAPLIASAAPLSGRAGDTATAAPAGKQIKLTLKNKTAAPMTVYIKDQPITIAANGGEYQFKASIGSDVLAADHTTVCLHVTADLAGNTVAFR